MLNQKYDVIELIEYILEMISTIVKGLREER
jgi:hypothetical protein